MFEGSKEELQETLVTQPSVFVFSYLQYHLAAGEHTPDVVAGHSLGEFTALVANGTFSFEDGLELVKTRATAMQKACEENPGTMSAVVGMDNKKVQDICDQVKEIVIAANYNCPGQIVISGSEKGISKAEEALKEAGAKRVIRLAVGGAFHSPLMKPAEEELKKAISEVNFNKPSCPIYQNVDGKPQTEADQIRENLIRQLTSPVLWTQTMENMIADGVNEFVECGGKVLSGFVKRVDRKLPTTPIM
jgi:[acyl-carrier-protein] S-malonyltransferase